MARISVILPIRNDNPEFLKEAVESLLNQTFTDFEILVIDDGDNEKNQELLKSYNDLRIKIIKGDKRGLPAALNKGINLSNSEFIARMDADDISYPERFKKQVEFLDNHPEISILGTNIETFQKIRQVKYPKQPKYFDFIEKCYMCHPSVMMRAKDLKKYDLLYDENYRVSEDYELWSRAVKFLNFANLQETLLKYRLVENSAWRANKCAIEENNIKIKTKMISFLTGDAKYQQKLFKYFKNKKYTFWQKIFFLDNERKSNKKWKVIHLFGMKFKFKVRSK